MTGAFRCPRTTSWVSWPDLQPHGGRVDEKTRAHHVTESRGGSDHLVAKRQEIVNQILPYRVDLSDMNAVSLTFYDENKGQFGERFVNGLSEKFISQMRSGRAVWPTRCSLPANRSCAAIIPAPAHQLSRLARDEGIRSYLCLPLLSPRSRLGVLCFYRTDSDAFTVEEVACCRRSPAWPRRRSRMRACMRAPKRWRTPMRSPACTIAAGSTGPCSEEVQP